MELRWYPISTRAAAVLSGVRDGKRPAVLGFKLFGVFRVFRVHGVGLSVQGSGCLGHVGFRVLRV